MEEKSFWYCPFCGEIVPDQDVTSEETHGNDLNVYGCGKPVFVVNLEELKRLLQMFFETETSTEAGVLFLRTISFNEAKIHKLLKQRGIIYASGTIKRWARQGSIIAFKLNPNSATSEWIFDPKTTLRRVEGEAFLKEHGHEIKRTYAPDKSRTKDALITEVIKKHDLKIATPEDLL
jgi:hypothetical protein